jgi:hypothetical protein
MKSTTVCVRYRFRCTLFGDQEARTVAQSTGEAECITSAATLNPAIWLRKILQDMGQQQHVATRIQVDNKSAITIAIAKYSVSQGKTKHIKRKFQSS